MARLVMVSNRVIDFNVAQQAGGVAVAIYNTLARQSGFWFGWDGQIVDSDCAEIKVSRANGHMTVTEPLTPADYAEYYLGYSNSVLWPVFHNRLDLAQFEAGYYSRYVAVNERFAAHLAPLIEPDDVIWVHDYHLLPMALELRKLGIENPIGYFLHIPVGPAQALLAIPENKEIARALSAYDLIGLQTQSDVRNLIDFLQQSVFGRLLPSGRIRVFEAELDIGCFPVGIDPADFAFGPGEVEALKAADTSETNRIIGIDRLDYTKGLPQKFRAYGKFLDEYPNYRRRIVLSQFAPPTRESVEAYADIKAELESLAGSINGRFGELDWVPINYIHRTIPRAELRDVYRLSRIGWVTPLMDGMNLVAKEFIACQDPADPGVLILSKFAGAAAQLTDAVLVNPYDVNDMVQGLRIALEMPLDERRERHDRLLSGIRKNDSNDWSHSYFSALMKAGQRRFARSPKSPPEMGQALERLQSSAKKNIPPSRLTANVVT
ncbi:alpha,alpha-trehalose-phosphate synthase (UDP-forming) [Hyphomicrobium facile]|uniref:Trehalose 6-phosphate synthase n=1 Tax=Hyphomicrobium facile TaxID=51670 RepID=A0A1I7NDA4_9HYPH|nr:trehalose-6-phosphate synthase [Hyphomicrobium facile]SFV32658.1 trehalose 6-phosphate synthase [Hyphomicrobium facile]